MYYIIDNYFCRIQFWEQNDSFFWETDEMQAGKKYK